MSAPSRHPLFPLLALLFEKCEQSTMSADCITSASFDVDIENFVRCQEKEGKPFFSDDPELDNLVRVHRGAPPRPVANSDFGWWSFFFPFFFFVVLKMDFWQ